METILVTGGTGLVGKAIEKVTKEVRNLEIIFLSSKDCDLTDYSKTNELFEKIKPNYVIHLAACVGGLFKNLNSKVEMFEKNTEINLNVLKCCHKFNVKKCISCLSTCIFPDNTTYPINEEMLHNGPPHFSNDAYAYAKRMLHVHSNAYQTQYNKNFNCVIPTNIYGPNDNFSIEDGHVIPGLIHKCYLAKKENRPLEVWGTGNPLRQFIYSEDLAKLIMWVLLESDDKDPIILSVSEDEECSIKSIAELIAKEYNCKIEFDVSKSDGQYKKTADNTKFKKLYKKSSGSDFKFTSIEDGIKQSIDWFNQYYDHARK